MTTYTYGDTALAGERLTLVADLFASSSEAYLRAAALPIRVSPWTSGVVPAIRPVWCTG